MPEILLPINQEDLPPEAKSQVVVELTQDPQQLADQVRNALYPGWYAYGNMEELSENARPKYFIECENPRQAFIAESLRPAGARLEIFFPEKQEEITEPGKSHPFIEKLKSVPPRYWTTLNVVLPLYGAMSFIVATIHASRNSEMTMPFFFLGTGLSLTSAALTAIRSGHLPEVNMSFDRNRDPKLLINVIYKN